VRYWLLHCMEFGLTEELAAKMPDRSNVALFAYATCQ
jgi:hypothetical protein